MLATLPITGFAEPVDQAFMGSVRPILAKHCFRCHSGEKVEAEIDFGQMNSFARARQDIGVWLKVEEMLASGQMPPKDSPQPSDEDRRKLLGWTRDLLRSEAKALANDPGHVLLRRLSNVEYTNTVRDLTGIPLDPARDFPTDGAAGEGFSNVGSALVMSPALLEKYLAAAKGIAAHAVLLPDGFRFSPQTTQRDWTDELVARIQAIYARYSDDEGRIPFDRYLKVTIAQRDKLVTGTAFEVVAAENGLSPRYLKTLWEVLSSKEPSLVLGPLRERWRKANPADVPALLKEIARWQGPLWRTNNVGYFKVWKEPVTPIVDQVTLRQKLSAAPAEDVSHWTLTSTTAAGPPGAQLLWKQPRLEGAAQPTVLLRDLPRLHARLRAKAARELALSDRYLNAAASIYTTKADVTKLAAAEKLDADILRQWLALVGISTGQAGGITGHLSDKIEKVSGYAAVNGWGKFETPSLIANASNELYHIPGELPGHSLVVHPAPDAWIAVGWQCPLEADFRIEAEVADAHAGCGNGVAWSLELRGGGFHRTLARGAFNDGGKADLKPVDRVHLVAGDIISLVITSRDHNHGCDTTHIDLRIRESSGTRAWNLAKEASADILAANPRGDQYGHRAVWHFYTGKDDQAGSGFEIPVGSLLAEWRASIADPARRAKASAIAGQLLQLVMAEKPTLSPANDSLRRMLRALDGPLFALLDEAKLLGSPGDGAEAPDANVGLFIVGSKEPVRFEPSGDVRVPAGQAIEARLPADMIGQRELVVDVAIPADSDPGIVAQAALRPGTLSLASASFPAPLEPERPMIARPGTVGGARLEGEMALFRQHFPPAACYRRIVPVDEVITLVLFHREDEPLARLLATPAEAAALDRYWSELRFVSQDALRIWGAFDQFIGFASQENRVPEFEPLRKPIRARAETFEQQLRQAEPVHVQALLDFAARAYRRPLSEVEGRELRALYARLRKEPLPHDEAFRLLLARVLVAPDFLYKVERPAVGKQPAPVSDWELASRISYFLWSSTPDAELLGLAASNRLHEPEVLKAQIARLRRDARVRSLATEFGCQWLDIKGFDHHNDKNEKLFPQFANLRGPMYEEAVRFFIDLAQEDRSILSILNADETSLNDALAKHYGIAGVAGAEWRRVPGMRQAGRGGILGMAATLAAHSGASRTSPILRGNWVSETLLGERLPKPPPNVPQLPESEGDAGLSVRQLVEKHRALPQCAVCHDKIDPLGLALEAYDTIGRRRERDLGGRPIDATSRLKDGTTIAGIDGLRQYLLERRRDDFLRNFCRKLLGYALGRGLTLADQPLVDQMVEGSRQKGYAFSSLLETIVLSRQFRYQRGAEGPVSTAQMNLENPVSSANARLANQTPTALSETTR